MLLLFDFDDISAEGRHPPKLSNSEDSSRFTRSRVITLQKFYIQRPLAPKPFTLDPSSYFESAPHPPSLQT